MSVRVARIVVVGTVDDRSFSVMVEADGAHRVYMNDGGKRPLLPRLMRAAITVTRPGGGSEHVPAVPERIYLAARSRSIEPGAALRLQLGVVQRPLETLDFLFPRTGPLPPDASS